MSRNSRPWYKFLRRIRRRNDCRAGTSCSRSTSKLRTTILGHYVGSYKYLVPVQVSGIVKVQIQVNEATVQYCISHNLLISFRSSHFLESNNTNTYLYTAKAKSSNSMQYPSPQDHLFTPFLFHFFYFVVVVVVALAAAERAGRRAGQNRSEEQRNHFQADSTRESHSCINFLRGCVRGNPISWRRAGWVYSRTNRYPRAYDSQLLEKQSFGRALFDLFLHQHLELITFGNAIVIVELTFTFSENDIHRKDTDNLIKFVNDALQLSNIINNDNQVWDVRGRKVVGEEDSTTINMSRQVLLVD